MRFGNTTGRRSHRGPLGPCTPRPTLTLQPGASALALTGPLHPGALRTHESLSTLDPKSREETLSAGLAPGKGQSGARKPSGSDLSLRHRERPAAAAGGEAEAVGRARQRVPTVGAGGSRFQLWASGWAAPRSPPVSYPDRMGRLPKLTLPPGPGQR